MRKLPLVTLAAAVAAMANSAALAEDAIAPAATTAPTTAATADAPATVVDRYPGLATGALLHARLADLPAGTVVRCGELAMTDKDVQAEIAKTPPDVRPQMEKNAFFLAEQLATKKLLLAEARRELAKAGHNLTGKRDQDIIRDHLGALTGALKVPDKEVDAFYAGNKGMFGNAKLAQVRPSLRRYLLQKKSRDFVERHVLGLSKRHVVEVSATWAKRQAALAGDNPVDRARRSGRPTLVDFGADGCRPCDMMEPILATLRKKYAGKVNVVFVHVRKEQILAARHGITGIPVQVFYDRAGREVFRHTGFFAQDAIEKKLAEMGAR